jgi:hypothetical protein
MGSGGRAANFVGEAIDALEKVKKSLV